MGEALRQAIESMWRSGSPLIYFPAFAAGVLVSFTPCVYPVLPIVVSVVTANAGGKVGRAFALSLTYAAGMALVYSILGVAAAMTGRTFGTWVDNPYVLVGVSAVFAAMGLWMLGVFHIPLPAFAARHRSGRLGGFGSTFFAGLVSAFVVGPCTAPVLFAMLGLIGTSARESASARSSALYGGTAMFAFAMGMAAVMIALATFSGLLTALPKPGRWMNAVKRLFGIIMILVGGFFFVRFLGLVVPVGKLPLLDRLLELFGQ